MHFSRLGKDLEENVWCLVSGKSMLPLITIKHSFNGTHISHHSDQDVALVLVLMSLLTNTDSLRIPNKLGNRPCLYNAKSSSASAWYRPLKSLIRGLVRKPRPTGGPASSANRTLKFLLRLLRRRIPLGCPAWSLF